MIVATTAPLVAFAWVFERCDSRTVPFFLGGGVGGDGERRFGFYTFFFFNVSSPSRLFFRG